MARFLIIDADGPHITMLAATVGRSGLRIEDVRHWQAEMPIAPASAEALGRRLRDDLAKWKIAPAPLVLGVGRDRVVLKEVKYPAVPASEEPAVVRFQAIKELTETADEVVIDYQPRGGSGSEQRALAVATRKEVVRALQLLAQTAGLKLHAIVPRPFALAVAVQSAQPAPDPASVVAVLAIGKTGGEFVVSSGAQVLFARPLAAPALASDQALLGEVRRNLAVYSGQSPAAPVKALYIAEGGTLPGLAERFRTTLAIPVIAVEPLAGMGKSSEAAPGQLAAAVGMGRLLAADAIPINFVKPREPKAAADPSRRPILLGAALALTMLLAFGLMAWMQLSGRDDAIASLRRELDSLTTDLTRVEPEAKKADEVRKWLDGSVVWLDELYDLAAKCPDLNKLRITQLSFDPSPKGVATKKHYVGRVSIDGLAAEDDTALKQFINELQGDSHYIVEAKNTKPLGFGADRRMFSWQFSTKFDLEQRPPDQYIRQFEAEAPAKRKRGGFDFFNFGGGQ